MAQSANKPDSRARETKNEQLENPATSLGQVAEISPAF